MITYVCLGAVLHLFFDLIKVATDTNTYSFDLNVFQKKKSAADLTKLKAHIYVIVNDTLTIVELMFTSYIEKIRHGYCIG